VDEQLDREPAIYQAQLPSSSTDWRLLLPLKEKTKLLVITNKNDDYGQYFLPFGIETYTLDSLRSDQLQDDVKHSPRNPETGITTAKHSELPFSQAVYDVIAMPFGFLEGIPMANKPKRLEQLKAIRHLIRPGGSLLIGFSNLWGHLLKLNYRNDLSTPQTIVNLLLRANYDSIKLFAAIPNPIIPEYIFPISPQTTSFFLKHRYKRKLPKSLINFITQPKTASLFSNLLSSYYAVAIRP
jgi:hypothetical protein